MSPEAETQPETPDARTEPGRVDTEDVRARMQRNRARLAGAFVEREAEIESLTVAPICGEHVLLVGPPGTAKSLLSRAVLSQFSDSKYWEGLLTRQTIEDQCMGHLDVTAFQAGQMVYIMQGHAPAANFCFIDETFKATGGLLNAWLSLLNERWRAEPRGTRRP